MNRGRMMGGKTMSADKYQPGFDVVHDALNLLQGLEFSTEEGATASSSLLRVVIAPRWNGVDAYQLMLTCFVFGDRKVDWANMPVRITAANKPGEPIYIFRVNPRGQAVIDGVPAGEYKVSTMSTYFGGHEEPLFAPGNIPGQLAAAGVEAKPDWPEPMLTCISNDARLIAIPEIDEDGQARITFESTQDADMDGMVRFALVDTLGKVVFSAELELHRDKAHNIWDAHWEGKMNLVTAVNLVFDYLPG
jgi:hypothetical protein